MRGVSSVLSLLFVVALGVPSACRSGSDREVRCTKGHAFACNAGPSCAMGISVCEHPEEGLTPCRCVDKARPPDRAPGDGGAVSPPPGPLTELGQTCKRDSECPKGAFCLSPSGTALAGGGPPRGVCVADCSAGAAACGAFKSARCVDVLPSRVSGSGDAGAAVDGGALGTPLCFETCSVGISDSPKCHGTPGVACDPLDGDADAFCRPMCVTDADCGDRACDVRVGVCVDGPGVADSTLGKACEPGADSASCDALCVSLDPGHALCSHRCIFGDSADCGGGSGSAHVGGCVLSTPGGDIGDVGYCAELCDCPADCRDSSAVCDPFDDATLESAFGRKGVCSSPALALGTPIACRR